MKSETIESLRKDHRRLCDKKAELYRRGSLRGIAGINQNLELLRYKIQEMDCGEIIQPCIYDNG